MKRHTGNSIIVKVTPDRMGFWLVMPVSQTHNDKIAAYLKQFDVKWDGAYLQADFERDEFVQMTSMYKSKIKDLDNGWPVKIAIDKWTFLQSGLVGYDAGDANILG